MNLSLSGAIGVIARQIDMERQRWIELFAGPGGMSEALAMLGIQSHQAIGIEYEENACATAEANGHRRLKADVATLDPDDIALTYLNAPVTGFHASPPCQGFSMAGKGKGREDTDLLLRMIRSVADGELFIEAAIAAVRKLAHDDKSALTLEPLRWIFSLLPETVTLEQVPAVLPLWEAFAEVLRSWGYSVWTGILSSEMFGVPQQRKRAILIASRVIEVAAPVPTHSKFHNRTPDRLDEGVLPWVSMAEALGWGSDEVVGFPRKYDGLGQPIEIDGEQFRARDLRPATSPSHAVTSKSRSWKRWFLCPTNPRPNAAFRRADHPAPTMAFGHDVPRWMTEDEVAQYKESVRAEVEPRVNNQSGTEFDLAWPAERPAPTVAGREIVTMPGANANRYNGSTKSRNDGVRVTAQEAGVIQSFPADYQWRGSKTSQFQQVGNAVPPVLGAHIASVALGVQHCLSEVAEAA